MAQIKFWRETSQSLALSIEQICTLCEDLAQVAASGEAADSPESVMANLQEHIEAVRRYAACIASDASGGVPAMEHAPAAPELDLDPYSLKELRRLMISEQCD